MQNSLRNTTIIDHIPAEPPVQKVIDCRDVFENHGLSFTEIGYYLLAGDVHQMQGWVLHLSVIRLQLIGLLEIIIPELIELKVAFKIVKNKETAKFLLDGGLGYTRIGKVVAIYPRNDQDSVVIAKKLISLTQPFRGPVIPTDIRIENIVFTRYENFDPTDQTIEYSIPFIIPERVSWPFGAITANPKPAFKKLWNNKYKPIEIIKPDAKGKVIKGIYFKGFLNIRLCLIKEGKNNMWADEYGRDIQDRLRWQYNLYKDLGDYIPTPQIFDLFEEHGDLYLVMEFIKGKSLDAIIDSIYQGHSWFGLTLSDRMKLITYLIGIIEIIERLHGKGYVHRDITPTNFMIDKRDRIFLIDMELTCSLETLQPNPPFKLGTFGFMSPQQNSELSPIVQDDIYGLGATMATIFTGISPVKFDIHSAKDLEKNLYFFCGNSMLARLIGKCLSINPKERPTLSSIKLSIETYSRKIAQNPQQKVSHNVNTLPNHLTIRKIIENAIRGLTNPLLMTPDGLWDSPAIQRDPWIGNEQSTRNYNPGLHTGMAGILLLLARAKRFGYNIDCCMDSYYHCWNYIRTKMMDSSNNCSYGLYNGLAGIALAIQEGIAADLLDPEKYILYISQCFVSTESRLDFASGIAGQGIALLQCRQRLESKTIKELFHRYIQLLQRNQLKNGAWPLVSTKGGKSEAGPGLAYGAAGVICFLLSYHYMYPNNHVALISKKGLRWLIKYTQQEKHILANQWSCNSGFPGVALAFILAYKFSKNSLYKEKAEALLDKFPSKPVYSDFTQAFGLAGLGEMYIEAFLAFGTTEWKERADWIANIFINTKKDEKENSVFWNMNTADQSVAGLMVGQSGIIHFLMRCNQPQKVSHLLFSID